MKENPLSEVEMRCLCSRTPLLAKVGYDSNGKPFVHVKVYKQRRLYAEVLVEAGVSRIRCRECLRWHKVTVREIIDSEQSALPDRIPVG